MIDHAAVDAFHKAAVGAGGTSNGKPGLRPEYHENYYGAFVLDPIGNNVEMVSPSTLCPYYPGSSGFSRLSIDPKARRSSMP
jgi:hypothetical protein